MDTKSRIMVQGLEGRGKYGGCPQVFPQVFHEKGFTLIEVLVTIVIITAVVLIAAPNISKMMEGYRVKGAARQVFSDMQLAKMNALRQNKEWALEFTEGVSQYLIKNDKTKGASSTDWNTGENEEVYQKRSLSEYGVTVVSASPGSDRFEFNPRGTATSGNVKVGLGSREVTVTVSSAGKIKIE